MPAVGQVASTDGHGLDLAFVQEFSERYLAAWNSHRPEQVLSLMTEDVVYDDAGWPGGEIRGHAALRAFLEANWQAIPDMKGTLEEGVLLDPEATSEGATTTAPRTTAESAITRRCLPETDRSRVSDPKIPVIALLLCRHAQPRIGCDASTPTTPRSGESFPSRAPAG